MRKSLFVLLCASSLLGGCGNDNSSEPASFTPATVAQLKQMLAQNRPLINNNTASHYKVLLFGNSHMRSHNLSALLTTLLNTGKPAQQASVTLALGGDFLDARYQQQASMNLLNNESWTHLVLQGQKYSISESVSYPTSATRYLVELAKSQQITPILFAEHALKGNFREGEYIYEIMQKIQQQNHACLAPIPHAWRLALTTHPELILHENDGNHASLQGAFLTALVLYEVITASPADQLPDIPSVALPAVTQQLLRQQASNSLQQYPACQP
jgi:hypothetical protein